MAVSGVVANSGTETTVAKCYFATAPLCLRSIKTMLNGGKQETNSSVAYLYLLLVVIVIVSS